MKKILALLLALCMIFALAACGEAKTEEPKVKTLELKTGTCDITSMVYQMRNVDVERLTEGGRYVGTMMLDGDTFTMATTAVLGCVLMVIFNVSTFSNVFGQFSSSSVILLVSMMVVGQALFDTGLAKILGRLLLKAAHGSERRLIAISSLACALISAFLSSSVCLTSRL